MAGSATPPPGVTARRTGGDRDHRRRQSCSRSRSRGRVDDFALDRRSTERQRASGTSASDFTTSPTSHNQPRSASPPHRDNYGQHGTRRTPPPRSHKLEDTTTASTSASRRQPSRERHSHHHHRRPDSPHRHKRSHSRSRSPPRHHHKRHRTRSPARRLSSSPGPRAPHRRLRSPRPAPLNDRARRPSPAQYSSHPRRRSRSTDSRFSTDSRSTRRLVSEERSHRRAESDTFYRERRRSPRAEYRRRITPSPHRVHRHARDREAEYSHRDREDSLRGTRRPSPADPLGHAERSDSRRSRSPPAHTRRSSRDSNRDYEKSSAARSDSRRRDINPSARGTSEADVKMYNRGGQYSSGYYGQPPYGSASYNQPPYGYPPQHQPYPHHGPPQQSGVGQYQPQPGLTYGSTPSRAPYPPRDTPPRGAMRGGAAGRGGRGHFANMSWTPNEGTKGGHMVQPGEKPRAREDGLDSTSSSRAPPPSGSPDDEDNPFRPPADLRADDESVSKKRKLTPAVPASTPAGGKSSTVEQKTSSQAPEKETGKSKISFSIKGRATQASHDRPTPSKAETSPLLEKKLPILDSPLASKLPVVPKSTNYIGNTRVDTKVAAPLTRKEKVRKKRIKVKPQLSEEFVQSESVYYRKTGNESVVGSGTYGKVYKGIHVYTGKMVALKKIRMEGERDGFPVTAIREIKLLQSLNHLNVVALQEVMVERNDCFMVFEYLQHDLTGLLNHPTFTLTAGHKKHLAKQLFEGLDYLHHRGVLHRDIKAANILVSNTGELRLADFGLARFYQKRQKQDYTNRVITIWYRSPELLLGETQYGPAVDIWSAACVLVEIFTRHAIFPGDGSEINQLDKIYNVLGTPSRSEWTGITELQWYELLRPSHRIASTFAEKYRDRVSSEAFELLQAMFLYDPANRPTAADVLEHPYFTAEEPKAAQVVELEALEGDWHEFESKALRKEKERQERETRRKEREKEGEKRKAEGEGAGGESKKAKTEGATAPAVAG